MGLQGALRWIILPGVVVHELAHAGVVALLPNVEITEIDLTSHVKHRGNYTLLGSVLIAYAPLAVNTAVALLALSYVGDVGLTGLRAAAVNALLGYFAFAAGMAAIPSWTDVTSPLTVARDQLASLRGLLLLPFILCLLVASIPFLTIAYARANSFVLYLLLSVAYMAAIVAIGVGAVELQLVDLLVEAGEVLADRISRA